jgi:hypothetical protein
MTVKKTPRKKPAAKKTAGVKRPARRKTKKNMRDIINVRALIEALEQHVLGEKKMTATQVSAALALLKKNLPDIAAATASAKTTEDAATSTAIRHEDALSALE